MDIIEQVRELGRLIQADESYKKMKEAEKAADADTELQELIKEFNLKRLSINTENAKVQKDPDKIKELNTEMQRVYSDIMSNEHMVAYNEAKQKYDTLTVRVNTILQNCIAGEDPDTTDFDASCTGSCSTCGGCG
ncbi:MAG: YlbF family regulator [Ruminococcus sp.]|nr:YlbF family regulator [Ruminococcus sp.]